MQIELVVACTDRKTAPVPPELRLGRLGRSLQGGATLEWKRRLRSTQVETVPAEDLYSGDHWVTVKSILNQQTIKARVRVWVCSAGYGLVGMDSSLKPYSATFAPGHPDSVTKFGLSPQDWWQALSARPQGMRGPRTLNELSEAFPRSVIIVSVSQPYLRALETDLAHIASSRRSAKCAVLTVDSSASKAASSTMSIYTDARWKLRLGGAMQSVNARLARWAIDQFDRWQGDVDVLRGLILKEAAGMQRLPVTRRKRMSDHALASFVRKKLGKNELHTASPLLRELRDSGCACEQGRFRKTFQRVRKELVRSA